MNNVVYVPDAQNWIHLSQHHRRSVYMMCQRLYDMAPGLNYPEIDRVDDAQLLYAEAKNYRRARGWFVWEDIAMIIPEEETEEYASDASTQDYA